jgi:DNA-binding XRE family transcriptional regulator
MGESKGNVSLKVIRAKSGFSQEQMAIALGISRRTYADIEKGLTTGSITFWRNIQRFFKIPKEEMWNVINAEETAKV